MYSRAASRPSKLWSASASSPSTLTQTCADRPSSAIWTAVTLTSPIRGSASSPSDRKSTRLNFSHLGIPYAVFCLEKKNGHVQQPSRLGHPHPFPAGPFVPSQG